MSINIDPIGKLEEKYSMFYRPEKFKFLGQETAGLLKFNCILTDSKITESQKKAYAYYTSHTANINALLKTALENYKATNHIASAEQAKVTSVEFAADMSFLTIETSWDPEDGLAAIFDIEGHLRLENLDDVL